MGDRSHDHSAYVAARAATAKSGTAFSWSANARRSGTCHPALNPGYGGMRPSLYPGGKETFSLTVGFDVTGSNVEAAQKFWADAPQLFNLIYNQGWLKDKHFNMQVAAIGDATCDSIPLQLSQFESDGVTVDQWIQALVLEGGGGGQSTESYEMAMWALCHQNKLEVWEHGGKGMLFMLFDEMPYPEVKLSELRDLYDVDDLPDTDPIPGVNIELGPRMRSKTIDAPEFKLPSKNIKLEDIAKELTAKYDCYFIISAESSYYERGTTLPIWEKLFGVERIYRVPDATAIVPLICSLIGLRNGVAKSRILNELKSLPGNDAAKMAMLTAALKQASGSEAIGLIPSRINPTASTATGTSALSVNDTDAPDKGITRL